MAPMRACIVCGKPLPGHRRKTCTWPCEKEHKDAYHRMYNAENAERYRANKKHWYTENREHCRVQSRRWRTENAEYCRARNAENAEYHRAASSRSYAENKDYKRLMDRIRHILKTQENAK